MVAPDSRGFFLGAPLAYLLGAGFVPVRRLDVLPWETIGVEYASHLGSGTLEIHADGLRADERVLVVDDLLASGGTAAAAAELVERLGGRVVAAAFLVELPALGGLRRLDKYRVESLIPYE